MDKKIVAIVPAAGLGRRFDPIQRKTFVHLKGLPLLVHTLKGLEESDYIQEIIPVMRPENVEDGYRMAKDHGLKKIKRVVVGGDERQDSVYNGLSSIKEDCVVLIHDGARPIILQDLFRRLISELDGFDGVVPGLPLRETVKEVDNNIVVSTVNRERLWSIQTPQVFPVSILRRAYEVAIRDGHYATDDSALVERIGGRVKVIMGSPYNIKVTTPEDIEVVKYLLTVNLRKSNT